MFCFLKKKKYFQLVFQNITQLMKKIILLMITNEEKEGFEDKSEGRWHYLVVKKPYYIKSIELYG